MLLKNITKNNIKFTFRKKNNYMKTHIQKTIEKLFENKEESIIKALCEKEKITSCNQNTCKLVKSIENIKNDWNSINDTMKQITDVLDDSVYGHTKAKRQIERVIGQWITGEQSGYCFGFEGPPGVGKTSLATKRIGQLLKR